MFEKSKNDKQIAQNFAYIFNFLQSQENWECYIWANIIVFTNNWQSATQKSKKCFFVMKDSTKIANISSLDQHLHKTTKTLKYFKPLLF